MFVEYCRLFETFSTRERHTREDACNDVVLASLVFNFEAVLREAKNLSFDPAGPGNIASEEIK